MIVRVLESLRRLLDRKHGRDLERLKHSALAPLLVKDPYTYHHCLRVGLIAEIIGEAYGLGRRRRNDLRHAGDLHDLGKLLTKDEILKSPRRLSRRQQAIIRAHVEHGVAIVSRIDSLRHLCDAIGSHHQWYDGGGYGPGLSGEAIPLEARIICASDAYDAMTTNRTYRAAKGIDRAFEVLREMKGSQFDPEVVDAMIARHADIEPITEAAQQPAAQSA